MITFHGDRTEFGHFHAQYLQQTGYDFFDCINMDTLRRQLKIYQKFYPEIILEVVATAEALKVPADILLYEEIASFVDLQRKRVNPRTHGCTIFAIHEGDHTFVGRNYDWLPSAREFFESYCLDFNDAYGYFAFSDEGVWRHHTGKKSRKNYFEDAVNNQGLYIGLTYSHIDKWNYGLKPPHLIRYVAEKCSTTHQAVHALTTIPSAIPKNYLVADAGGDLAVIEQAAKLSAVVRPKDGVLVKTNHCLSPDLQRLDRVLSQDPSTTSFVRFEEAAYLISRQLPNFQFTDLWRILRESHYVYNPETIWSLALDLSSGRYNIYFDTAMGQKHQKFGF